MATRIRNASTSLLAAGTVALALLGASVGVASMQLGQPPAEEARAPQPESELRIGTYEPQRAFQQSHFGRALDERMQAFQGEFQQALETGNQERAVQIQQQVQLVQNEIVQEFLAEVEKAMPAVAAEAGVKVVVIEVVYVDPEFEKPQDLTDEIIEQLNGGAEDESAPEPSPFAPPQGE